MHNLRVKATKCHFGAKSVRFLGHVVSSKGVHTDPQKIDVVSILSIPRTIEHVRSFLGLAGYYRRFIREFTILYVAHYDDHWRLGHQCDFGDNLVVAHSTTTPLLKFG